MTMKQILAVVVVVLCSALLAVRSAAAQPKPLWISYTLPTNPDLEAAGRETEARARTQYQAALVICGNGDNAASCTRQAEITFRGYLLAIQGMAFKLYGGPSSPTWLLDLPRELAQNPDWDQNFFHLNPGRVQRLGIHLDEGTCQLALDSDNRAVDVRQAALASTVCELSRRNENATSMLVRLLPRPWSPRIDEQQVRTIGFLLEHGADPNARDGVLSVLSITTDMLYNEERRSANYVGTPYGLLPQEEPLFEQLVRALIDHGSDVKADNGWALFHAAGGKSDGIVELLIAKGADVSARHPQEKTHEYPSPSRQTALHRAAKTGAKAITVVLIAKGADVNARNDQGISPLHLAAFRWCEGNPVECAEAKEIGELLLSAGAEATVVDKSGETPLHNAALRGNKGLVASLLASGADVNAKNGEGNSPLHLAATYQGTGEVVDLLLGKGADINAKNNDGETPLQRAVAMRNTALATLLRQRSGKS